MVENASMTNFEKIKNMSAEELADFICELTDCNCCHIYCSGGCAANSYNFHGTITDAYDLGCELQKKRIECAIMIKAAEADMADDAQ